MKNRNNQRDYIRFIVQGEKLDGFMRIAQQQEQVQGLSSEASMRKGARDDSASNSIYNMKSISYETKSIL
jgi:hypothetical protein